MYSAVMLYVKIRWKKNKNKRADTHLCFMVPYTDAAIVQTGQHPWFRRMKVYAFDTVRSSREFALDVQPQRLEENKHY